MVTVEDLESFLIRMDVDYEELEPGMFLVQSNTDGAPMVVHHSAPLLLVRLKVMDLPESDAGFFDLYKHLLELKMSLRVEPPGAHGLLLCEQPSRCRHHAGRQIAGHHRK